MVVGIKSLYRRPCVHTCCFWITSSIGAHKMNKTILSIVVNVVFFLALAFSHSNANVCTISENSLNAHRKTPQELSILNATDQYRFKPVDYFVRDTYRTRNLNIRTESRRISVNGKEEERRIRFVVDDTRRVRLSRSESLPDVRRERVRVTRERVADFRGADRRATERNDRRFLDNRSDERTSRRETRDTRFERLTTKDDSDARRRTAFVRQNTMVAFKDKDTSTWPFSNFVQSTIGVLGLYYFGMHNKSSK